MVPDLPRNFSASSSASSCNKDLVDSIISQAMDQVALEQIAALNTAHLGDDSSLPDHLESRFRKLKSFPGAAPEPRVHTLPFSAPATEPRAGHSAVGKEPTAPEPVPDQPRSNQAPSPKRSPPPPPVTDRVGDEDPPVAAANSFSSKPGAFLSSPRTPSASRSRCASHSPRLHSPSPSPPRGLACCFGISPRSKQKSLGRRSVEGRSRRTAPRESSSGASREWDLSGDDDLLSELELGTLSIKEQGKKMKRALREQEKAAREAEKIVEWVRQASARLEFSAAAAGVDIGDLLSDEEKENRM